MSNIKQNMLFSRKNGSLISKSNDYDMITLQFILPKTWFANCWLSEPSCDNPCDWLLTDCGPDAEGTEVVDVSDGEGIELEFVLFISTLNNSPYIRKNYIHRRQLLIALKHARI